MRSSSVTWTFARPDNWLPLPAVDGMVGETWIDEVLGRVTLDAGPARRLAADLDRLAESARAQHRPDRRRYAYIPSARTGEIAATLSVDFVRSRGVDLPALLERIASAPDPEGTTTWSRTFTTRTIAGRATVVGREVLLIETEGEHQANEHFRAYLPTSRLGVLMRFDLSTPELALFADIVEYGCELLERVSFDGARTAA